MSNNNWRWYIRAFSFPNYRNFFYTQIISVHGTWLQTIAQSWLVYRLTDSALILGLAAFCSQIFMLLLGPIAGVLADRYPKNVVFYTTQIISCLVALAMAIFVWFELYDIPLLLALISLLGAAAAIEVPSRQSINVGMVGRENVVNAISYNSLMFNLARVLGPIAAAYLISHYGEALCFFLNFLSFIPVIIVLMKMKLKFEPARSKDKDKQNDGFFKAVQYITHWPAIFFPMLLVGSLGLFTFPFQNFIPVYAKELEQGVISLGWLSGALGVGTFFASLTFITRSRMGNPEHRLGVFSFLMVAAVITFAFSTNFTLSLVALSFAGFAMISILVTTNSYFQTIVPLNLQGRVLSFYFMMQQGMIPFGSIMIGYFSDRVNKDFVIAGSTLFTFCVAIYYYKNASRNLIWRRYMMRFATKE